MNPSLWYRVLDKVAVGFAVTHHLLAVRIEGVVNDPFCGIYCMIILVTEMPKAFCNGFQSRSFWLLVQGVVGVRAVDDFAQKDKRPIIRQFVFL